MYYNFLYFVVKEVFSDVVVTFFAIIVPVLDFMYPVKEHFLCFANPFIFMHVMSMLFTLLVKLFIFCLVAFISNVLT